mmetsp:Transcript_20202/g.32094  ORF Transcript_20202/g.32094 Transcript_20202/m.32094 type:complete len:293 (-) Transcript_20202:1106-1984(-)
MRDEVKDENEAQDQVGVTAADKRQRDKHAQHEAPRGRHRLPVPILCLIRLHQFRVSIVQRIAFFVRLVEQLQVNLREKHQQNDKAKQCDKPRGAEARLVVIELYPHLVLPLFLVDELSAGNELHQHSENEANHNDPNPEKCDGNVWLRKVIGTAAQATTAMTRVEEGMDDEETKQHEGGEDQCHHDLAQRLGKRNGAKSRVAVAVAVAADLVVCKVQIEEVDNGRQISTRSRRREQFCVALEVYHENLEDERRICDVGIGHEITEIHCSLRLPSFHLFLALLLFSASFVRVG